MKSILRPVFLSLLVVSLAPLASAHPGHDGGHELTWNLDHLVAHPVATFAWAAFVLGGAWAATGLATAVRQRWRRSGRR